MCTFLGIAGKINENDIDENVVKKSEITFLEGYLWDEGDPQKLLKKLLTIQKRLQCPCQIYFVLNDTKKFFRSCKK